MKKKNNIIVALGTCLLVLLLVSCGDYLDKDPENKVNETQVDFTNLDNLYQPVSGMYAKLRTSGMHWVIWLLSIVRDDDCWSGNNDGSMIIDYGNYKYDNSYWGLNEYWNQYYGMIKVANSALQSLDSYSENMTTDDQLAKYRSYCGEVRILRAYAYFRLTQAFGPVTILRDNNQKDLTRSTVNAVYKYILEDLQYAMDNCPKLRPNEMEHKGAATAYTAEMMAAKIYLYQGNYEKVEELTNDIINSKKFTLYEDYYELFKIPGKLCDESLLESQNTDFNSGSGDLIDPDAWFTAQGPINQGSNISGWGLTGIYKELRDWAKKRGETVRYETSFLEKGMTTRSGDYIAGSSNTTQTDCWNGKAYTPLNELTPGRTKYGTNNNERIFRYSDVLLMNAEAKVRLGKNGDEPFNIVRRRAKMPELQNVTLDQIIDERRMEFCCEWGERYYDLVRTGKAEEVLGPKGWTKDKTYYPLPYEQIMNVPAVNNEPKDE